MNIQSAYNALNLSGMGRVGFQQSGGASIKSAATEGSGTVSVGSSSERVTISAAAMALMAQEKAATQKTSAAAADKVPTQGRTAMQEKYLKAAANDPLGAEKFIRDMVNTPSTIFYDISDQLATGTCTEVNKLSSTGRIIDDAFRDKFATEAASVDAQMLALYNSEKAKGTSPVETLGKLFDLINSQSRDYLEATCWLAKPS